MTIQVYKHLKKAPALLGPESRSSLFCLRLPLINKLYIDQICEETLRVCTIADWHPTSYSKPTLEYPSSHIKVMPFYRLQLKCVTAALCFPIVCFSCDIFKHAFLLEHSQTHCWHGNNENCSEKCPRASSPIAIRPSFATCLSFFLSQRQYVKS